MVDDLTSQKFGDDVSTKLSNKSDLNNIIDESFESCVAQNLYPNGRTARTLCKECNSFLGKYDEAYLKFYNADGNLKKVNGFSKKTKLQIIKAIYAKFLSVPETFIENFDFIDFIKNMVSDSYDGMWHLYFIGRDYTTDIMEMPDIGTGKENF